jgi:hypothetical protein
MASQHAASRRCVPRLGFRFHRARRRAREVVKAIVSSGFFPSTTREPNHPGQPGCRAAMGAAAVPLPAARGACLPTGVGSRTGVPGARKAGAGAACCGPRSAPCHAIMRRARARARAPAAPPGAPWTRATEPAGETHVRFGSAPAPRTGVSRSGRGGGEARTSGRGRERRKFREARKGTRTTARGEQPTWAGFGSLAKRPRAARGGGQCCCCHRVREAVGSAGARCTYLPCPALPCPRQPGFYGTGRGGPASCPRPERTNVRTESELGSCCRMHEDWGRPVGRSDSSSQPDSFDFFWYKN